MNTERKGEHENVLEGNVAGTNILMKGGRVAYHPVLKSWALTVF